MKLNEVLKDWPLVSWSRGRVPGTKRTTLWSNPDSLRLLGFAGPDRDGWFSITVSDRVGGEWSSHFCIEDAQMRDSVEFALTEHVGDSLAEIGDLVVRKKAPH